MGLAFLFGLIGLIAGGLRGLLIGVLIGFVVNWGVRSVLLRKLGEVQAQFLESTFAVMGAMCKADGVVTRDEIAMAESIFARLNLSPVQRESAKAAFARGKEPSFELETEVRKFVRATGGHRPMLLTFLQIQCTAIAADGNIHPAEHAMLVRVARVMGLTEQDVAQLEALLRTGRAGPAPQQKLDDAYAALGLTAAATDAEVKQAYRRLMSQNHPDKLAAKGLPESMRQMAEERTRELSTAYALIKEARGFN